MRGFLLFLALAFPVVVASPVFWSLVAMEVSVSPVTYGHADGSTQQALLGPKAPWPDWAAVPHDTAFTVRSWFGPAPGRPASGQGRLAFKGSANALANMYADQLRGLGWTVETYVFRAGVPNPIGPYIVACVVEATRPDDPRALRGSFTVAPDAGTGSLHWSMSPWPPFEVPRIGPC